ncbi:hypothetical protein QR680_019007 [Steinernema hermaphroditum]|uniref:Sulfotransferase domain-containing protein n=1 Tax=Steinernema hermaphroditum TaxID=289476 RepID=A0AA39HKN5_9BILA|nr:hypothetical protein QR680_019007 [Steinernema hermaphroditum]
MNPLDVFKWATIKAVLEILLYVLYLVVRQVFVSILQICQYSQGTANIPLGHGRISIILYRRQRAVGEVSLCKLVPRDNLEWAAVLYGSPYSHYLKNKKKYTTIVWYHDVMEDAEKTMSGLFEKLNIPQDCVPLAMKCKSLDSQDGTFLSREALSGIKTS